MRPSALIQPAFAEGRIYRAPTLWKSPLASLVAETRLPCYFSWYCINLDRRSCHHNPNNVFARVVRIPWIPFRPVGRSLTAEELWICKKAGAVPGIFPKTLVPTGMVLPTEFWDKAGYCLIFGLLASGGSGFSEQRARCAPQRQDKWAAEAP